jgi:hypothetical protein
MSNYVEARNCWEQVERSRSTRWNSGVGVGVVEVRPREMRVMGAQLIKGIVALSGPDSRTREDGRDDWKSAVCTLEDCEARQHPRQTYTPPTPAPCH